MESAFNTEEKKLELVEVVVKTNSLVIFSFFLSLFQKYLKGRSDGATFYFRDEDHTLGNSLRYVLSLTPHVSFVGYTVPHPSNPIMNLRIQTVHCRLRWSYYCGRRFTERSR